METNKNPGDEVPPDTEQSGKLPCAACGGSGVKDGKPCPDCGGTGEITVLVGDA
jgi:DnaJ-class molecular chaperone